MITQQTKVQIKGYLEGFIQGIIDAGIPSDFEPTALRPERKESKKGDLKPFHEALLPSGILSISEFERSLSTKLGTSFEECARLIALDYHVDAERGYVIEGDITEKALGYINKEVNKIQSSGLEDGAFSDIIPAMISYTTMKGPKQHRKIIADLRIVTKEGHNLFFELKSPKPNMGQCIEATRKILETYAICPKDRMYLATAYNPWGEDISLYNHDFAKRYLDLKQEVVIGQDFWSMVGGPEAYSELLELYKAVGKSKGSSLIERFTLG